ncbi:MAG: copper resistance protein CopC [Alphaproteobacteria bacterium]|nr:copper resistance protein CopC [Alphaproteobacteria bacterium]
MIRVFVAILSGVALAVTLTLSAAAHTTLTSSVPADGAEVAPPEELMLEFGADVKLARVQIVPIGGKPIRLKLDRSAPASTKMVVPVGEALAPGAYVVEWRAVADDGHIMTGEFGFSVR